MTTTLDDLRTATTVEEVRSITDKYVAENGLRLPTIYEVMDGFFEVFKAAGMDKEERVILSIAAGQFTRGFMAENDAKINGVEFATVQERIDAAIDATLSKAA